MPTFVNPDFVPLYIKKGRTTKLKTLLYEYPQEPFLHFWRIIEASVKAPSEDQALIEDSTVNQPSLPPLPTLETSLDIIFADNSDAGLYARSHLLYLGNPAVRQYAQKTGYFKKVYDSFTDPQKVLDELNQHFPPDLQLSAEDLPSLCSFWGLWTCANRGFGPAIHELAKSHYHLISMQENAANRDQTVYYYQGLECLNKCSGFPPVDVEKACWLFDSAPLFDEEKRLFTAENLLARCKAIPTSPQHKAYADTIDCYKDDYALLTANTFQADSTLLGRIALKLAIKYKTLADTLQLQGKNSTTVNFFNEKAKEHVELAIVNNNYKAKEFQAYLISQKPFGKTIFYKEQLQYLLKQPTENQPDDNAKFEQLTENQSDDKVKKDPKKPSNSDLNNFKDYADNVKVALHDIYNTWSHIKAPSIDAQDAKNTVKFKPSSLMNFVTTPLQRQDDPNYVVGKFQKKHKRQSHFISSFAHVLYALVIEPMIEGVRVSEASAAAVIKMPLGSKPSVNLTEEQIAAPIHPIVNNADIAQIVEEGEFVVVPNIKTNDLFRNKIREFSQLRLKQNSLGYFSKNYLGDYDSALLIKICNYLNNTNTDSDKTILETIEKITHFKQHPLYDPKGELAKIINSLYSTLNVDKPEALVLPHHIKKYHFVIAHYEALINQRHRQFTDPRRIRAVIDLRVELTKLAESQITIGKFYETANAAFKKFDDGELGHHLSMLCNRIKEQIQIENTQLPSLITKLTKNDPLPKGCKFSLTGAERLPKPAVDGNKPPEDKKRNRCCF